MATLGGSCIDRSYGTGGNRTVLTPYTFSQAGHVTSVCVYVKSVYSTASICAMFFRPNGSNWDYIGESDTQNFSNSTAQSYTLNCDVNVLPGDKLGYYMSQYGEMEVQYETGGTLDHYLDGKQTGTNLSFGSGWEHGDHSILATYDVVTEWADIYVDINKANDTGNGLSWANAKKTMSAGYAILSSTGTLHVASGDYSAQTAITYNKSWSLSPEDPNAVGYKSVSIPSGL